MFVCEIPLITILGKRRDAEKTRKHRENAETRRKRRDAEKPQRCGGDAKTQITRFGLISLTFFYFIELTQSRVASTSI